jgi:glucose-1-phosphate thymidylyltransferase
MKVVIPVAGEGTRLRPHTHSTPKPLLEIAGKPILDYILRPLEVLNPEEVIFVIGYRGEQIKNYVSSSYKFKSTFVVQDNLLGLGYAISLAMPNVGESELLMVLGDTIVELDLKEFVQAHKNVLGVRKVDDPQRFGIAAIENEFVSQLVEKPKDSVGNLALIGLYYISDSNSLQRELTKLVNSNKRTRGEIQLTDALQGMIESGTEFKPFEVNGWFDCGTKETTLATNRHFLKKISNQRSINGCKFVPPVYISNSANIEKSIIGPNVSVGDSSIISDSEISNSIIGKETEIKSSKLKDSLVGRNVLVEKFSGVLNLGDNSEICFN